MYRSPEEVFKPESLASFKLAPVTLMHPPENISSLNWKYYSKGSVEAVWQEGDLIKGNLLINDETLIREIQDKGLNKISCGYDCLIVKDNDSGLISQTRILVNHVAIVLNPRAGDICAIIDSIDKFTPKKETKMTKRATLKQKVLKLVGLMDSEAEKIAEDLIDEELMDSDAHKEAESKAEESIEDILKSLIARLDALESMNTELTDEDKEEEELEDEDEKANGEYITDSLDFFSKAEIINPGYKIISLNDSTSKINLWSKKREVLKNYTKLDSITKTPVDSLSDGEVRVLFDSVAYMQGTLNNIRPFEHTETKPKDPNHAFIAAFEEANKRR
jgi:hypothetical protein